MGYKPWTDSTLMTLNKKELIEHIRMLEHNLDCKEETIARQLKFLQEVKKILGNSLKLKELKGED